MRGFTRILIFINYVVVLHFCGPPVFAYETSEVRQNIVDSITSLIRTANHYKNLGDYEQALKFTERSHKLRKRICSDTSIYLLWSYMNMASANLLVYDYEGALNYLHEAEMLCESDMINKGDEIGTIYIYYARISKSKGNYIEAIQYLHEAEDYIFKKYSGDKPGIVSFYMQFANLEMLIGDTKMSLFYYQKCFEFIKELKENDGLLINYYTGMALTYARTGDYLKSIQLQKKAILIARNDSSGNALRLAILYNNIGLDYLEARQFQIAEKSFQAALIIFRAIGVKGSHLAELYESLGKLRQYQGLYKQALAYYQKALEITAPKMPVNKLLINPEVLQIEAQLSALKILKSKISCLEDLFKIEKEMKYLEAAINTSLRTIELIDNLRNSYQSYESKIQTAKHEYEIYNKALSLLNIAFKYTGNQKYNKLTYIISEKSKSSVLLSILNELDARQLGEIPDSLLVKERSLARYIQFYKENIYEEKQSPYPDSLKIRTWDKYLFDAQRMHTELIDYFEKNYSKYYNLKYENTVADIKKLQENLSARTTLMEYSLSDTVLYTMIITRNKYTVIRQSIDSSFNQLLNRYLSKFHNFDFSRQSLNDFTEFCWYSQSLYNILIAPAIKYISGNSLVIVPDGLLSYLPFETLIKDIPDEIPSGQYRYLNYLINYFEISYSYSATLFDQVNRKKKKTAIHELLAFAPEYTSDTDKQISVTGNYFRKKYRKNLHPIPGVYDEVKSIHKLISGEVYYGGEATEKNFLATAGYFDILHLAMHTVIDNYNPLYSKLIFTLDSDSLYDGYLNTSEVFGLNLKARMVVLSACSTGEGEFNNGEGVMSLARGFVYAGSPSIIMTMWEVEDKSGAELMKNFYKNLLRGQSKPKAMRNAKLTCIKKFRPENTHPFFWSSFVVMGNGQPLFINRKIVLRIFVLLIFAGAIAVIIFFLAGFCTNRKK